jgi:hypothetical protein
VNTDYVNAPEMLAMPRASALTADQIQGIVCVWCGGETRLDLGPRLRVIDGELSRWHPRACLPCAAREAARVCGIHRQVCPRCTHRVYCPDGAALLHLAGG